MNGIPMISQLIVTILMIISLLFSSFSFNLMSVIDTPPGNIGSSSEKQDIQTVSQEESQMDAFQNAEAGTEIALPDELKGIELPEVELEMVHVDSLEEENTDKKDTSRTNTEDEQFSEEFEETLESILNGDGVILLPEI